MTDDRLVFEAPLPEDMQAFVRGLEVDDTL